MLKYLKMKRRFILIIFVIITVFLALFFYYKKNYESIVMRIFVEENLKEKYIPKELVATNKLIYADTTNGTDNLWGDIWYIDNMKLYTNLYYNKDKSGISNFQLFIFTETMPEKLDEETASLLISEYFKVEGEGDIECRFPTENVDYCEKFWITSQKEKKGIVVVNAPENKFIAMCKYPKESEEYELSTCVRMSSN